MARTKQTARKSTGGIAPRMAKEKGSDYYTLKITGPEMESIEIHVPFDQMLSIFREQLELYHNKDLNPENKLYDEIRSKLGEDFDALSKGSAREPTDNQFLNHYVWILIADCPEERIEKAIKLFNDKGEEVDTLIDNEPVFIGLINKKWKEIEMEKKPKNFYYYQDLLGQSHKKAMGYLERQAEPVLRQVCDDAWSALVGKFLHTFHFSGEPFADNFKKYITKVTFPIWDEDETIEFPEPVTETTAIRAVLVFINQTCTKEFYDEADRMEEFEEGMTIADLMGDHYYYEGLRKFKDEEGHVILSLGS